MTDCSYGPALLKIEHVSLEYDGRPILRDVNAEIVEILRNNSKGQVVGFLGPSGIGKTQLFRIIAGLNRPTAGQVVLNGNTPVHPGLVGVVAQDYPLFNHRTVFSNLMLAAARKDNQTANDRVKSYLEEFDLAEKRHLYPMQLSGGQRQRVAILQQILCSSHFLILDEPFSGLDMVMLEKVGQLIQKIANLDELNTILITTHDITAAASVSDHLWMLGRERDDRGFIVPGTRIMKVYDLVAEDLCWHQDILTSQKFVDFVRHVKEDFRLL